MAKAVKKSVRVDPPIRSVDGVLPYTGVKGKSPEREYVWVSKSAQEFGVEHYEYLGWEVVSYETGGPRPSLVSEEKATKLNGQLVESRGNVLMSIAKERYQEIVETGEDGASGQKAADAMERRLLDRTKHVKDAMRGINPRLSNGDEGFGVEFDRGAAAAIPVGADNG